MIDLTRYAKVVHATSLKGPSSNTASRSPLQSQSKAWQKNSSCSGESDWSPQWSHLSLADIPKDFLKLPNLVAWPCTNSRTTELKRLLDLHDVKHPREVHGATGLFSS